MKILNPGPDPCF